MKWIEFNEIYWSLASTWFFNDICAEIQYILLVEKHCEFTIKTAKEENKISMTQTDFNTYPSWCARF